MGPATLQASGNRIDHDGRYRDSSGQNGAVGKDW